MADRFLIDSMIFDRIIDTPGALELVNRLQGDRRLTLISTHLQRTQLERTPDPDRRALLLSVVTAEVPVSGFVFGYSRFGDRLSEEEPYVTLQGGNLNHTEDALIAATAQFEEVALVTDDATLAKRARRQGISVVDWPTLHEQLLGLGDTELAT